MNDYRYNAFDDVLEPVSITGETHIIPSNSPYTIRLSEVPQKTDPSSISLTIAGVAASEVAAQPAAGEFWPDYSTGADGDTNWNTGLIKFNAADAGKTVVVAYNGIGTLVSVNGGRSYPDWFYDRGDGSDGDFNPSVNTTIDGLKQYTSINIPAGVTVTVNAFAKIKCQGPVTIAGIINVTAGSSNGGLWVDGSPKAGGIGLNAGNGGVGGGNPSGAGGVSRFCPTSTVVPTAAMLKQALYMDYPHYGAGGGSGGSGGNGGNGGGCLAIVAETINLMGTISAQGANGTSASNSSGGGGGGGVVKLIAKTVTNSGTVNVAGGNHGGNQYPGANGTAGLTLLISLGA